MRGRGRGIRGNRRGMGRPPMPGMGLMMGGPRMMKSYIPRPPFDLTLSESAFPPAHPTPDDKDLTQAIVKRCAELAPTSEEQASILKLVTQVQSILDTLSVAPGNFDACQLEEVRLVGSFKKGTMIRGHNVADVVAILKTLPIKEVNEVLGNKTIEELKKQSPDEEFTSTPNERGFVIAANGGVASVRVLIAVPPTLFRSLDSKIHMQSQLMCGHMAAIRHSRWFEENANHTSIKMLIRIIRDMKARYTRLAPLNPWIIDLLAHYSLTNTSNHQMLPVAQGFRRCLQLVSSGIFLPGSAGIMDPCEPTSSRVHMAMSLQEQDTVCLTMQTLLRLVAHGGYQEVLGLQLKTNDITKEVTVLGGIVISPLNPVYESSNAAAEADPEASAEGEDEGLGGEAEEADVTMESVIGS